MIATKQMDLRANIKKYFDLAFNGETIIVSRKENKNVVVISEQEYNELLPLIYFIYFCKTDSYIA